MCGALVAAIAWTQHGAADFGDPRMSRRVDGHRVTLYYWLPDQAPEAGMAATLWSPPKL